MRYLRIAGAVIAGYAVMVILITLVQEVWFGGVSWAGSSPTVLTVAGFFTFLSAVCGGATAAWTGGRGGGIAAGVMCILVAVETIALTVTGKLDGPLWFDVLASGSLIVGILLGAGLYRRCCPAPRAPVAA